LAAYGGGLSLDYFRCPGSRSENIGFSGCKMTDYRRKTVDFEAVFEGTNHREAWTPEDYLKIVGFRIISQPTLPLGKS
tara:strand:+ start:318 stop:551 length:234 start_codon:yes stop_codon:yes gene_type:complete